MIQVTIHRNNEQHITAYQVSGHAEYDESGKDIVCAGVSSVVVGTVNAIEQLLSLRLEHSMKKGLLVVRIPELHDHSKRDNVQLLLESMFVMLKTIEQSYGEYVQIDDIND